MAKNWKLLCTFLTLVVLIMGTKGKAQEDPDNSFYYEGDDYDGYGPEDPCDGRQCSFYDDETCAKECHINKLPAETIQEKYGDKVETCCSEHGYTFHDQCEERDTANKLVCGHAHRDPTLISSVLPCPKHCTRMSNVLAHKVSIEEDTGKATLIDPPQALRNAKIDSYCAAYMCHFGEEPRKWGVGFELIVCPNPEDLKSLDAKVDSPLRRCCPNSLYAHHDSASISCPLSPEDPGVTCPFNEYEVTHTNFEVQGNEIAYGFKKDKRIKMTNEHYCIGSTWRGGHLFNALFTCKEPCDGRKPCLRICDQPMTGIKTLSLGSKRINASVHEAHSNERSCKD